MTTEDKALALANEVRLERGFAPLPNIYRTNYEIEALCRAIEQHEAFRQEVSDELIKHGFINASIGIGRFIIPAPKPDPLVDAMAELAYIEPKLSADKLRAALEARGLEIREKNDD